MEEIKLAKIHNHERFPIVIQYEINEMNRLTDTLQELWDRYSVDECIQYPDLVQYISSFSTLVNDNIERINNGVQNEIGICEEKILNTDCSFESYNEYRNILNILRTEIGKLSDQIMQIAQRLLSDKCRVVTGISAKAFMTKVIEDAKKYNIDCFIATEAGSLLYGDHNKFNAKDLHLMVFGTEMPAGYGKVPKSVDDTIRIDNIVRKHITNVDDNTTETRLELSNKEYFTFQDIINWVTKNRNELMTNTDIMNYYFIVATDVVLSVRFHNIDYREIWIYTSPSMNLNNIEPFAVVKVLVDQETFDPTGNISIMSVDNGKPVEESEIIVKSSDKLNGTRWWDRSKYKNVFSTVELVLTALLCMNVDSLVPLSKKEDWGV